MGSRGRGGATTGPQACLGCSGPPWLRVHGLPPAGPPVSPHSAGGLSSNQPVGPRAGPQGIGAQRQQEPAGASHWAPRAGTAAPALGLALGCPRKGPGAHAGRGSSPAWDKDPKFTGCPAGSPSPSRGPGGCSSVAGRGARLASAALGCGGAMWLPGHYLLAPQPSPSFVARLGGAKNPPGNIYWSTPHPCRHPTLGAHTARMADTDPQCSVRPGPRPPAPSGCPLGAVRPAACTLVPAGPRPPWGPAGRSVLEERAARGPCSRPSALPSQREARSGVHCAPTADQGVGRPRSASSVGAGSGEGHSVWRPKCHRTGARVRRSACLEGALKPGQGLCAGRDRRPGTYGDTSPPLPDPVGLGGQTVAPGPRFPPLQHGPSRGSVGLRRASLTEPPCRGQSPGPRLSPPAVTETAPLFLAPAPVPSGQCCPNPSRAPGPPGSQQAELVANGWRAEQTPRGVATAPPRRGRDEHRSSRPGSRPTPRPSLSLKSARHTSRRGPKISFKGGRKKEGGHGCWV